MSIKSIVKLFIPPIVYKLQTQLFRLKKRSAHSFISTINNIKKDSDILIVIGNGPSLKKTLEKNVETLKSLDCIVVNHFCESEYYKELKPKYYLLADPAFFGKIDNYSDYLKKKIRKFIVTIVNETFWDLNLIIPNSAIGSEFIERCKANKYIHPYYYNPFDICYYDESEKFELWNKNLIAPPMRNCLNTCLWFSIFLKFKYVYLIGADSNWLDLIHVDQSNNSVYTMYEHFYDKPKKLPLYYDDLKPELGTMKLYEFLEQHSKTMKIYWDLYEYSVYNNVKIYNSSEYSLIDAFERKKL